MEDALRKAAEERERKRLSDQGHGRAPERFADVAPTDVERAAPAVATKAAHPVQPNTAGRAAAAAPLPARASGRIDERLVVHHAPADPRSEQFRKLRANLLSLSPLPRLIMVTSGAKGEGKSLAAANMALTLLEIEAGEVLLVDANLRHPGAAELLAAKPGPGLSELIAGIEPDPSAVIQATDIPGLRFVAAGAAGIAAARLLRPGALKAVLDQVATSFRFVVVDTPALDDFADAALMSPDVDGVLVVIAVGAGRRDATKRAVEVLESSKARVLGTVVLTGT